MDKSLYAVLPQVIQTKNGNISLSQLKDGSPLIALYFSAHWCPPCKKFIHKLEEFYTNVNSNEKEIEIIYVSLDNSSHEFKEYYNIMPWAAIPYDSENRELIAEYFEIQGIPAMLIFTDTGKLIDKNGRNTITSKKEGAISYWKSLK
jgi:nucleoredoxin